MKVNNRITAFVLAILMLLPCMAFDVLAENKSISESEPNDTIALANAIELDENVTGEIPETSDMDFYTMTLPASGRLTLTMTSHMRHTSMVLYDQSATKIWDDDTNEWNSATEVYTETLTIDLEAGTYYFMVVGTYWWDSGTATTGDYNFIFAYANANANIEEPNNTIADAKPIEFDSEVKGIIAINDSADCYTLALPTSGRITINMTSHMRYTSMVLYDHSGAIIWDDETNEWNAATEVFTETLTIDLEAGTYYFMVVGTYWWDSGTATTGFYGFVIDHESANANIEEPNNTIAEAKPIEFDSEIRGIVAINDSHDCYQMTLPTSGRITINMTSYMRYTSMVLFDQSGTLLWDDETNEWNAATGVFTETLTIDLEAGTYYFMVLGTYWWDSGTATTGFYGFVINHESANANIDEPNNTIAEAKPIEFDTEIRGIIAINDSHDCYQVTMPTAGKLTINMTSYMRYTSMVLYDQAGTKLWDDDTNEWNAATGVFNETLTIDLEAGTYYFMVLGTYWWDSGTATTGSYSFTMTDKQTQTGDANCDGKVNTGDAVTVLRYAVGDYELTTEGYAAGDFNSDGNVNTGDAVLILKYCVEA